MQRDEARALLQRRVQCYGSKNAIVEVEKFGEKEKGYRGKNTLRKTESEEGK